MELQVRGFNIESLLGKLRELLLDAPKIVRLFALVFSTCKYVRRSSATITATLESFS